MSAVVQSVRTKKGVLGHTMTMPKTSAQQSGFTLVEMAIVLVIIGLLLGGVLKGQELVVQARVKSIINDFNQVTAAYYTYFDRYRKFPGDDTTATTRWTATQCPGIANGDTTVGIIGAANIGYLTASIDNTKIWQHLRCAGIINGSTNDLTVTAFPVNSVGGFTGIQEGGFGILETVICTSNVPVKLAELIDYAVDDGDSTKGILRSGPASAAPGSTAPTVAYNALTEANTIVCRKL